MPSKPTTRKLDFMNDDEGDLAYSMNPADDMEDEVSRDYTMTLSAGNVKGGNDMDDDDAEIARMMGAKIREDTLSAAKPNSSTKANAKKSKKEAKGSTGAGSWQSMGLAPPLLRSLLFRGFKIPTPIQRAVIPSAIASPPRDLVGMARTGSGKTLAYMAPLLHRFGASHSTKFGPRALILCPGRELAFQILRVGKDLARGLRPPKGTPAPAEVNPDDETAEESSSQSLRWGLVVGGESLDDQFSMIASNPDVIIATPGRLLHLIVEMNMDLRSLEYVVFDEADRLFEMGFETQLHEILSRLPITRQTMLFSATLPNSLVDFAKAGLNNPKLVRLDADSKVSPDLRMSFLSVKPANKEGALLSLIKDVLQIPCEGGSQESDGEDPDSRPVRKSGKKPPKINPSHQAIIFTATKHHVEYLTTLLRAADYSVSHIYGSLDQTARKAQMDRFRNGLTKFLVVTDVAARGIDIPVLENVINYDFPSGARVFVHRVGRTARAGRKGHAWSFVTISDLPYFLDLQLFLDRPLVPVSAFGSDLDQQDTLTLGPVPQDILDVEDEYVSTTLAERAPNLKVLKDVLRKAQAMYDRSQGKASQESYTRAKAMVQDPAWQLEGTGITAAKPHPVYQDFLRNNARQSTMSSTDSVSAKSALLKRISAFQPSETIFEMGQRGNKSVAAVIMQSRRKNMDQINKRRAVAAKQRAEEDQEMLSDGDDEKLPSAGSLKRNSTAMDLDQNEYRDEEFYMPHRQSQSQAATDRGYSLTDGQSFVEQARHAAFDLTGDEGIVARQQKASMLSWDRKKKKFVQGDGAGSDNKKIIKTESGARLPATYRSGRFDEWKNKKRIALPRIGEAEGDMARSAEKTDSRKYRHNQTPEAKPLDRQSTTYEKKLYQQKKKAELGAKDLANGPPGGGGKSNARNKSELRDVSTIRKNRQIQEQRRAKNARPSKKGGKGRGRK